MKRNLRYLTTSLMLAAATLLASLGPVMAGCKLELSTGMGVAQDKLDAGFFGGKVDLNQTGALLGAGLGCDPINPATGPVFGVLARYSVMRLNGDVGGSDSLKSERLWEAAARAGYRWHDKFMPYVLAGWSGMNLDLPAGSGSKEPNGFMAGVGFDAHLTGAWGLRGEYADHFFSKQDLGGGDKLTPNLHIFRIALTYQLTGDLPKAAPLK